MLRYRVTLVFDNLIIAEALGDDLQAAITYVLTEGARSADLVASRVKAEVGVVNGRFYVESHYLA